MIVKMYVIYDKVSESCGPIQFCENAKMAERMFKISTKDVPEDVKADFLLKYIGEFDTKECKVVSLFVEGLHEVVSPDQLDLFGECEVK